MGHSSWSDDFYADRVKVRASTGKATFDHHDDVVKGRVTTKLHDSLNPNGVTRESRDSDAHPDSTAIGVIFDVTGSMGGVPRTLQTKLPDLMGLLLRKGYIKDPQVCFGAVGDNYSDQVPFQIGQFESGVEMDDDLTKIYLEGRGGGSNQESYENALYFFGRKTSIDCHEKRGKKGYLYIIGDERAYEVLRKSHIEKHFGDNVQDDIPLATLLEEVREKYEVFFVIPQGGSHTRSTWLAKFWIELLGEEYVIHLEDDAAVCEAIGFSIGLMEGTADMDRLRDDVDASVADVVEKGLTPLANSVALTKTGTGALPPVAKSTTNERL